jgi:hypothetical protein
MKRKCHRKNSKCGKRTNKQTKPVKIDDFDEDLDGKYYIKIN